MFGCLLLLQALGTVHAQYSIDGMAKYAVDAGFLDRNAFLNRLASTNLANMEPEANHSCAVGDDAILPCTLYTTSEESVAWMDKYDNVLYYNDQRMIDDLRFEVMSRKRPVNAGSHSWNLKIKECTPFDAGMYRCLLNTDPVKVKVYELVVFVPAKIDRITSTKEIHANEGMNISLVCNVSGYPEPKVTWSVYSLDDAPGLDPQVVPGPYNGEVLTIYDIKRNCNEIFTCSASNKIGNGDVLHISVKVRFAPSINLPNTKLYHKIGRTTVLTCIIESFPRGTMYWAWQNKQIMDEGRFRYTFEKPSSWKTVMRLEISSLSSSDFGDYKCVVYNSMGDARQFMELADASKLNIAESRNAISLSISSPPGDSDWSWNSATSKPSPIGVRDAQPTPTFKRRLRGTVPGPRGPRSDQNVLKYTMIVSLTPALLLLIQI